MFDDLISSLENRSDEKILEIRELGAKHGFMKKSGFKPDIWEKFGEVAVDVIGNQDVIKQTQYAMSAWTMVIACATDEIRYGYEQHCRVMSRQISVDMKNRQDPIDSP